MKNSALRIQFNVRGIPVPQGALKIGVVNGHGHLFNRSSGTLAAWRHAVAAAAQPHAPKALWEGPVTVALTFRLQKPKSAREWIGRGKQRHRVPLSPAKRPDVDKLVRAVLDSLTGVIFEDDAQVVGLWAEKVYDVPGVLVTVMKGPA